jgi:hypothetical protein
MTTPTPATPAKPSLVQRLEAAVHDIPEHLQGLVTEVMDRLRAVEHVAVKDTPAVEKVAADVVHDAPVVAQVAADVEHAAAGGA